MSDENTMFIVILALIVAVACGWGAGHSAGYQDGIAYQTAQPVNVSLSYYEGATLLHTDNIPMTRESVMNIARYSTMTEQHNVTHYRITI